MTRGHTLKVSVLRLGHRVDRDKRMTSHLGLTARAFGADEVILSGDDDPTPIETWSRLRLDSAVSLVAGMRRSQ